MLWTGGGDNVININPMVNSFFDFDAVENFFFDSKEEAVEAIGITEEEFDGYLSGTIKKDLKQNISVGGTVVELTYKYIGYTNKDGVEQVSFISAISPHYYKHNGSVNSSGVMPSFGRISDNYFIQGVVLME